MAQIFGEFRYQQILFLATFMPNPNVDRHGVPHINRQLLGWFLWFVKGYLNKHFHAIAINRQSLQAINISDSDALVVYANHASWWDPLTAIYLSQSLFPHFAMYAPIDADALAKYRMFGRMGFFGVEQQSLRGASDFLKVANEILRRPAASLWLTPEGRFADVRDQSAELMPGLAHLAWKLASRQQPESDFVGPRTATVRVWFLPVAVEYTFWEERHPELLVWFGQPIDVAQLTRLSKPDIALDLTNRLRAAQRELAQASMARDVSPFDVIGSGRGGTFFIYDWWHKLTAKLSGRQRSKNHGQKFNSN